jgi:hypothetical protein
MDYHADTCCIGKNSTVLYSHNRTVNVSPFLDSLETADSVPIVTAATAYDDKIMAKTYILIVHEALYFGDKLEHNLLNLFQCRLNGINIKECPHILDPTASDDSHLILFPNEELKIPLLLNGILSYFPSRRPTKEEFERCPHIELTPDEPECNPHDEIYSNGEITMTGDDGNLLKRVKPHVQTREVMGLWTAENMAKYEDPFLDRLERCVRVGSVSTERANKTMWVYPLLANDGYG